MQSKWLAIAGRLLSLASVFFLVWLVFLEWEQVISAFQELSSPALLVSIFTLLLLNHFISVLALAHLCDRPGSLSLLEVQAVSQIAKYLPGNVFHLVSRVAMAQSAGVEPAKMSEVTIVEILGVLMSGVLFTAICLLVSGHVSEFLVNIDTNLLVVLVISIVLIVLVTSLLNLRFNKRSSTVNLRKIAIVTAYYLPIFLSTAFAFYLLMSPLNGMPFSTVAAANTVAWIAGFVVPGAPGGLGVREVVLYQLFQGDVPEALVLYLLLVMRCMSVVTDFTFYMIGLLFGKIVLRPNRAA